MQAVLLRPLYVATVLAGSFLLFLIQPLFARMILPLLGGAPSVWNVAMLFYQAVLLAGYLYAHALQRLPLRVQLAVHLTLLVLAGLTLPVAVATWFPAAGAAPPALWLLGLLAASIGPAFFVVSAQAPLMQAWLARSRDAAAANPFFLYAASNIGSLAALLAYPLLLEPTTRLALQARLWSWGFVTLVILVALAALAVLRGGEVRTGAAVRRTASARQRLRWTALAFVPSGLLLSTTTHITTDVMAMPLLWVIPLATYLLTFIIAFSAVGRRATAAAVFATPLLIVMVGAWAVFPIKGDAAPLGAVAGLVLLFAVGLALHGTLATERPAAADLTEFYLWVSVGGVLGGLACALVAPMIFDWVYEHPLLLIAAAALIPVAVPGPIVGRLWTRPPRLVQVGLPIASVAVVAVRLGSAPLHPLVAAMTMVAMAAAFLSIGRGGWFAVQVAALLLAAQGVEELRVTSHRDARTRTFFGIYEVIDTPAARTLQHGTTLHGVQSRRFGDRLRPTSYYAPGSGVGGILAAAPRLFDRASRVGVVGLGAGTLACYAQPGQPWTFFEIDPAVQRIAQRQFTFLSGCAPRARIVIGDARLSLDRLPPNRFDILVVDAFASDSIPLHLMTREAFALYGRMLPADGVLMVHVSNRFLTLEPVVAAIVRSHGWSGMRRDFQPGPAEVARGDAASTWLVVAKTPARLVTIRVAAGGAWSPLATEADVPAWSDDFASILPVITAFR
ncbi:MAG: fused MFS/spermidine synthase [Sphingomonadaceae bacterium]|nr:fused MFS/spermidine synthase [Sphingomonadaceae bacterium]